MALWGRDDYYGAEGTVTLDYTGVSSYLANDDDGTQQTYYPVSKESYAETVSGGTTDFHISSQAFEVTGSGTTFGNVGAAATGDIIRFGVKESADGTAGTYFGDAIIIGIASATSLTIGSTNGLSGAAIAATSFSISQLPDYTITDGAFSQWNDGGAIGIGTSIFLSQLTGTATTSSPAGADSFGMAVQGADVNPVGSGLTADTNGGLYNDPDFFIDGTFNGGDDPDCTIINVALVGNALGVASTSVDFDGATSVGVIQEADGALVPWGIDVGDKIVEWTGFSTSHTITGIGTANATTTGASLINTDVINIVAPSGIKNGDTVLNNGSEVAIGTITASTVITSALLGAAIADGETVRFSGDVVSFTPGTSYFGTGGIATDTIINYSGNVVSLASTISTGIATGGTLQFKRFSGGSAAKYVYGVNGAGVTAANESTFGGEYAIYGGVAAGWVGVQTYIDCEGQFRVKKDTLVAIGGTDEGENSGIQTGNVPAYPPIGIGS